MAAIVPATRNGAFIVGLALSLTLGMALAAAQTWRSGGKPMMGNEGYDGYFELAASIARQQGFAFYPTQSPVVHRPPLAPAVFAPITLLPAGLHRPGVVVVHSLLFAAVCWLMFDLALRLFDRRVAQWSLVILATYPWFYWHIKNPINNICQLLMVILIVNLLSRELALGDYHRPVERNPHWIWRSLGLGLACAGAVFSHGAMLLSVPLLLLAAIGLLWRGGEKRRVATVMAACLVAMVAVLPWTWRNYRVAGRFIPVVGGAGLHYFFGNAHWHFPRDAIDHENSWRAALAGLGVDRPKGEVLAFGGWKDLDMNQLTNQRMAQDMLSHPARLAAKLALNAVEFYFPSIHSITVGHRWGRRWTAVENAVQTLWHFALWTAAAVGLYRPQKQSQRRGVWMLVGCIVLLIAPYFPFVACIEHGRYVVHTLPFLALAAAVGIAGQRPAK